VGRSVSQRALARAASVSKSFAAKIIEEVESSGLIDPNTQYRNTVTKSGASHWCSAGSKTLDLVSVTKYNASAKPSDVHTVW
jgi:hypothetical protein